MLIDAHCHLHDPQFFSAEEAESALKKAHEAGITKIICIGTDPKDSLVARDFAEAHDNVYWTYGIHPSEATKELQFGTFQNLIKRELARKPRGGENERRGPKCKRLVAIGEVGLDYHYEGYDRETQIRVFEQMLQLAKDNDLPVSFHVREAFADFFGVVANFPTVRGVVHSFTDSKKVLKKILNETNYYVGVNGLATYSTLPTPPIDRILLETDAPFLAPIPHRGDKNEPAYIADIAKWLAEKMDLSIEEIAEKTTANTSKLFDI